MMPPYPAPPRPAPPRPAPPRPAPPRPAPPRPAPPSITEPEGRTYRFRCLRETYVPPPFTPGGSR